MLVWLKHPLVIAKNACEYERAILKEETYHVC